MIVSLSQQPVPEKGKIVHQEHKQMEGEKYLLNVFQLSKSEDDAADWYDEKGEETATKSKIAGYRFEAYSNDSAMTHHVEWDEEEFDKLFRFNAELMNPNHKVERYHWVCERLYFAPDGNGGRVLKCSDVGATVDASQGPKYSQQKIPIGKSDYEERAKLRHDMEFLEKKRQKAIAQKEAKRHATFNDKIMASKKDIEEKDRIRAARIANEKKFRLERMAAQAEIDRYQEAKKLFLIQNREKKILENAMKSDANREQKMKTRVVDMRAGQEARMAKLDDAQADARAARRKREDDQKQEVQNLRQLEAKRDQNLAKRAAALKNKEMAYLGDISNQKRAVERTRENRNDQRNSYLSSLHKDTISRVTTFRKQKNELEAMFTNAGVEDASRLAQFEEKKPSSKGCVEDGEAEQAEGEEEIAGSDLLASDHQSQAEEEKRNNWYESVVPDDAKKLQELADKRDRLIANRESERNQNVVQRAKAMKQERKEELHKSQQKRVDRKAARKSQEEHLKNKAHADRVHREKMQVRREQNIQNKHKPKAACA